MDFFGGDLEVPGSYNEAVKGCEGVFVCALPEKPRYVYLIYLVLSRILKFRTSNFPNFLRSSFSNLFKFIYLEIELFNISYFGQSSAKYWSNISPNLEKTELWTSIFFWNRMTNLCEPLKSSILRTFEHSSTQH